MAIPFTCFSGLVCGVTLTLLAALCPTPALGLDRTYEGVLKPEGREKPIPIVIRVKEVSVALIGSVTLSAPLKGSAPIQSGSNTYGQCTVNVTIPPVRLRMYGTCETTNFTGSFTMYDAQKKIPYAGTFNLRATGTSIGERDPATSSLASSGSATACLKSNTACLSACPHDDEGAGTLMLESLSRQVQDVQGYCQEAAPSRRVDFVEQSPGFLPGVGCLRLGAWIRIVRQ